MHDTIDPPSVDRVEEFTILESAPARRSHPAASTSAPALSALNLKVLAEHCLQEISNYRRGEPYDDQYGLELFRRATILRDEDAWIWLQQCFDELLHNWMRRHPSREVASRFDSAENYIAQAFERFWQATACNQKLEFNTLTAALGYLRASLNGTILDTLRAYSRPKEVQMPEPGFAGEPYVEDDEDLGELWETIQHMLPSVREQRLGYLLFHCGLKPRDIIRYCPQEFSDVQEIYRLRRNIMERLLRNADQIRWRLGIGREDE